MPLDVFRNFDVFLHAGTDCAVQSQVQWTGLMWLGTGAFYFVLCVVNRYSEGSFTSTRVLRTFGVLQGSGSGRLCSLARPLCVVSALAPGSGSARLRRFGLSCCCCPRLSERWVKESLVLCHFGSSIGDSVLGISFRIGYQCALLKNQRGSRSIPTTFENSAT